MAQSLRVFGMQSDSIVDGTGLRLAVFTQGCPHGCPGCHNPDSHAYEGGYQMDIEAIAEAYRANPLLSGLTLTGGEPMEQAGACLALLGLLPGANVWLYTGWTWDELHAGGDAERIALAEACDVLVDGRFVLARRSLELRFCGSDNQRLIDVQKTRRSGGLVLWAPPVW